MAEFRPLLQAAVAKLAENTPAKRRNVYERARSAFEASGRERDAQQVETLRRDLEEAIRDVESRQCASDEAAPPAGEQAAETPTEIGQRAAQAAKDSASTRDFLSIAYGACVLGLLLIAMLPPECVEYLSCVIKPGGQPELLDAERLVWFAPILSVKQNVMWYLFSAEIAAWLIAAGVILVVFRRRKFHIGRAAVVCLIALAMSVAVPIKRNALFVWPSKPFDREFGFAVDKAYALPANSVILKAIIKESQTAHPREEMDAVFATPEYKIHPVSQFVFGTITEGVIAPAVFSIWLLGVIASVLAGFLTAGVRAQGCSVLMLTAAF